jgi:flavin-dependent thymidylate synthase
MENKVELIGFYGGDETHALSAWTSTSRDMTEEKRKRMDKLIYMLANQGHHTPFEKSSLHFLVTCDTASHIHLIKHRIGVSINAESARYKELKEDKYIIPDDWPHDIQEAMLSKMTWMYDEYHNLLEQLIEYGVDRKRAKESARFILPYANQVTMDVSFNFRSFMHFQGLRNKPEAQKEIRDIATEMLRLVKETKAFEHSLKGFGW